MKKCFLILTMVALGVVFLISQIERHVDLEKEILGDWLSAEFFMAQPPPELQQSIKSISFQTDNLVEWEYIKDGKALKAKGRYGICTFPADKESLRKLPSLIVAPKNSPNPALSSQILLKISDVELDFDSRFLQSWGKLIKAIGPDKKRLLFLRKETNRLPETIPTENEKADLSLVMNQN